MVYDDFVYSNLFAQMAASGFFKGQSEGRQAREVKPKLIYTPKESKSKIMLHFEAVAIDVEFILI